MFHQWSSPLLIGLFNFTGTKVQNNRHIFAMRGTNEGEVLCRSL
jgi:hypothetical protein